MPVKATDFVLFYTGSVQRGFLPLMVALAFAGCAHAVSGGSGASAIGSDALDLTVGVLPVKSSLPGSVSADKSTDFIAEVMNGQRLFKAVEATARNPDKRYDLLLVWPQSALSGQFKVFSGYSNKVLYEDKVMAPGGPGIPRGIKKIAKVFAAGLPLNQELLAERQVFRGKAESPTQGAASLPAAPAAVQQNKTYTSDVDVVVSHSPQDPKVFAIIIGIERFSNLPDAQFAERDAEAVKNHLYALGIPPRNIVSLTGSKATRSSILGYLNEWLPKNLGPDSTLYFYYSGHGAPDPKTGEGYLVPWDGNASFLQSTAIQLKDLYSALAKLRAKNTMVVLDACFSGAGGRSVLAQGARPLVVAVQEGLGQREGLTLLTAASGDEITATLEAQGHGLFTYFFLKGLSGAAKDSSGRVTVKGLFDYLKPQVQDEAHRQNREQNPLLQGGCQDCELVRF